jgi:hypothetical protein
MGQKRAKRRRREWKRTSREQRPLVPAGTPASGRSKREPIPTYRLMPRVQPEDEWPGDALALELRDEPDDPEGGATVREPRRPKPNAPLAGAASVELPRSERRTAPIHGVILPPE